MTEKRFTYEYDEYNGNLFDNKMNTFYHIEDSDENIEVLCDRLNWLVEENKQLKSDLKDCKKLKGKRLRKIRNHRAVIEELGGVIKAYKGKLSQANEKIEKIKEAMEDTGALTKRQLEEILK